MTTDRTVTIELIETEARELADGWDAREETRARIRAALAALPPEQGPMEEPTFPRVLVGSDDGVFERIEAAPGDPVRWKRVDEEDEDAYTEWGSIPNPCPLTAEERAEHGIPGTLPDLDDPGLVERVAKALYDSDEHSANWGDRPEWIRDAYRARARIALTEIAKTNA